ncbi:hypothetical protein C8N40_11169 [Pontibacter mucosus]|uniref:Uncharacterized protein n=1 Tax=Pontibacter mucosus TaxID=1649266 RepID=A0A2T5YD22_9BACT|nr:hypothetical protein [Pontibacter mucosus]PTX14404.1 hypothetical protein C8N40_11169 [Pontibacter mucosus]
MKQPTITPEKLQDFIDSEGVTFAQTDTADTLNRGKTLDVCLNGTLVVCHGCRVVYRGTDAIEAVAAYNNLL